jgi:hypothetical protein
MFILAHAPKGMNTNVLRADHSGEPGFHPIVGKIPIADYASGLLTDDYRPAIHLE